jgi:Na+-translocating ferredoxin:NAD+ oxidoreductase subunit B
MENSDNIYFELQKHLDKQAVGFPATQSGVEIRILKELFNPEQARLALHVNYQPQSAKDIFNRLKGSGLSLEKVQGMLEAMVNNGAISSRERNGTEQYFTIPLLIGIVELHGHNSTPQFGKDFAEYMGGEFGKVYAKTKVSQMRTVPVEKSILVEQHVTTYDDIRAVINSTDGPITVGRCMCREGAKHKGHPCQATSRMETCMTFGDWARLAVNSGRAKAITRQEALEITRQNEEDGLVLQPNNYQKIDFICACCGCCCGVLSRLKHMPKPAEFWSHNFYAEVNAELCSGCGTCAGKCQVNAAKIDQQTGLSSINLERCIGCGNCVAACPSQSLRLVKVEKETAPPEDSAGLLKILVENKTQ